MISYTVGTAYTYGVAFPPDWGRWRELEQRDSPISHTKRGKSSLFFPLQCRLPAQVSC